MAVKGTNPLKTNLYGPRRLAFLQQEKRAQKKNESGIYFNRSVDLIFDLESSYVING